MAQDQTRATGKRISLHLNLGKRTSSHLIFIYEFLLAWLVGHMDPHKRDWVTKPGKVVREFELETYQLAYNPLTCWAIRNSLYYMWKVDREMGIDFQKTFQNEKSRFEITHTFQCCFHTSELEPATTSSSTFWLIFGTLFMNIERCLLKMTDRFVIHFNAGKCLSLR